MMKNYVAKICVSMIPVFIVGIFFKDQVESFWTCLLLAGCCLLVTAGLLFAYFAKPSERSKFRI